MDSVNSSPPAQITNTTIVTTTKTVTTTTIITTTKTPQGTTIFTPFRFLDLSCELRAMVYEELVVVGKVFYTPDAYAVKNEKRFEDWESYQIPSLDILRVCKQVHDEAEEVYLGKNLFVLPDHCIARQPLTQQIGHSVNVAKDVHVPFPDRWLFSASAPRLIKNISVGFSLRSNGLHALDHSFWEECGGFDNMTPADRLQCAHEEAEENLSEDFQGIFENLTQGFRSPTPKRLDYLEFDLTNAYCPTGCCRMVYQPWGHLMALGPRMTAFLGVRNAEEEETIMDRVHDWHYDDDEDMHEDFKGKLEVDEDGMREVFGMVFNPQKIHWEQWKINKA